jgi:hypothetical protein
MPESIPTGPGRETVFKLTYGVHMPANIRRFRCAHVSATEAGEGPQVLFAKAPESDEEYVLFQRHFQFPDGEECYVESDDPEFCSHFRIHSARLSGN